MNWKEITAYANVRSINERLVEVSEGVWVIAGRGKIKTPPDPCWIILNQTGGVLGDNDRNSIYVFSSEKIAIDWINETEQSDVGYPHRMDWDAMTKRYASTFFDAIVDITPEEDWLQFAPLIKKEKYKIRE